MNPKKNILAISTVILIVCVCFVVYYVIFHPSTPSVNTTKEIIKVTISAIEEYKQDTGKYPSAVTHWAYTDSLLRTLQQNSKSATVLAQIDKNQLTSNGICDEFDKPLIYLCENEITGPFYLVSAGKDGKFGNEYNMGDSGDSLDNIRSDNLDH